MIRSDFRLGDETRALIDKMDYEHMFRIHWSEPLGSPWFLGEVGDYFLVIMREKALALGPSDVAAIAKRVQLAKPRRKKKSKRAHGHGNEGLGIGDETTKLIDAMGLEEMLRIYRFDPMGSPWLLGWVGEYFSAKMVEKTSKCDPSEVETISKRVGKKKPKEPDTSHDNNPIPIYRTRI